MVKTSRSKHALVGGSRLRCRRPRLGAFFLLQCKLPLWRFLIVEPLRLRCGLSRERLEASVGHDQAERGVIRRRLIQDHRVVRVSPTGHGRSRFDLEPRRDTRSPRRPGNGSAVDCRERLDHVSVCHALRPFVTVVHDHAEQSIVVEAEQDLVDRVRRSTRRRSGSPVRRPPFEVLQHGRAFMNRLRFRRRQSGESRHGGEAAPELEVSIARQTLPSERVCRTADQSDTNRECACRHHVPSFIRCLRTGGRTRCGEAVRRGDRLAGTRRVTIAGRTRLSATRRRSD